MLRFLIFAWQFGFGGPRAAEHNPHPYHSGNTKSEKKAFKRAKKRKRRSWWPRVTVPR